MADDSSQEKTEEATPKKLREAKKKGQVAKSRDLATIFILIGVFVTFGLGMAWMGGQIKSLMTYLYSNLDLVEMDGVALMKGGKLALMTMAKVLAPIFLVGVIISIAANFFQVGAIFATEPLKPNVKKLNIIEGFKNLFKTQTFIELGKTMIKIIAIFILAYFSLKGDVRAVLESARIPIAKSLSLTGWMLIGFLIKVFILFLIVAVIDYGIQRQQFAKQMKMSKDEVKREYKQDEGDPIIKNARRQMHREFAFGDVQQAVKQSDAVVTNPVHVAVAIKYDREEMIAPEIMYSGKELTAQRIREIAEENGIPIIRNVSLAWALVDLDLGEEIPEDLYEAVAEILSYVYRLKQTQA